MKAKTKRQRLLAGMVGSGLEWYDFAIYGNLASLIATLFFPANDSFNALLATFGIFALGFLMRPLGGILFGHFGDRIGRSRVLVLTVFGMTIPTVCIGLLPTYHSIGILAPLLLLLARLIQGLVIGGEYTGALLFLAEDEAPCKRAQTACLAMVSVLIGMLTGSLVITIITHFVPKATITAWVWRIPFLLSGIFGLIGYYLRRWMQESPAFLQFIAKKNIVRIPALTLVTQYWQPMLLAIGICVMTGVAQYLMFTYFPSYIQRTTHFSMSQILPINTIGLLITIITIPIFAKWSDRIGRRPILLGAGFGFLCLSLPLFYCLAQPSLLMILLGISAYSLLVSMASAPMAALYIELFPTMIRYSGIAISYNIAFALFAGTAPVLATLLVQYLHTPLAPAFLLMAGSLISLACFRGMPETAGKALY